MSEVRRVKLRGRRGSVWTLPVATAKRQYGGRGLARASLWIPLPSEAGGQHFTAASWLSRFKEAYEEHVEGFHGRAFSASVRRQRQANMDWKVLQHAKWTGMIPGQQADEAGADRSMSGSVDREGGSDRAHDYDPHTQQHGKPRSRRRRHKDQGTHSSTAPSDGNNTAAAVAGGGSDPYTNKKMHSLMQQTMSQVSNKKLLELEALRLESIGKAASGQGMRVATARLQQQQQQQQQRQQANKRAQKRLKNNKTGSRGGNKKGGAATQALQHQKQQQSHKQKQGGKKKKKKGRLLVRPRL